MIDCFPYYPEGINDDPTDHRYGRFKWDMEAWPKLGFKDRWGYFRAIRQIRTEESWKRYDHQRRLEEGQ